MDFSDNINTKSKELIRKAKGLLRIPIKWEKPIIIHCKDLESEIEFKASKVLDVFEGHKKKPAIYYFEIVSKHSGKEIVETLSAYKDKKKRSCPKIDKKRSKASKYLYCGSRKEGLYGRFIQHLGFGSQNTYALQLFHWAKEMELQVKFHFTWLDPNYKEFTELVESALADKLKPLVGKKA